MERSENIGRWIDECTTGWLMQARQKYRREVCAEEMDAPQKRKQEADR
jgi:hypothetical protein